LVRCLVGLSEGCTVLCAECGHVLIIVVEGFRVVGVLLEFCSVGLQPVNVPLHLARYLHDVFGQLGCQVGSGLIQSSIGPVSGHGGDELGFGVLKVVGHDVDGVVFASTGRTDVDARSWHGGFQAHGAVVAGGAMIAGGSDGVTQVDMVPDVGRGDVAVRLVYPSQHQASVGVDLADAEACSVRRPQVGVGGSGHHGVPGEDVQPVASGG